MLLTDLAQTLISECSSQAILDRLIGSVVDILPITCAGITLLGPEAATPHVTGSGPDALGLEQVQNTLREGPCVSALTTGVLVAAADLALDQRFPSFGPAARGHGVAAVFSFPLRRNDQPIGTLTLYRGIRGDLAAGDLALAQTLADVAAAYVLNAQSREQAQKAAILMEHDATHDPLTGLANRMLLQQRLDQAEARAQRTGAGAMVVFIDLNRFKRVNDTHGHRVGDELLKSVADRLSELINAGDTLARVSGDEFVILCSAKTTVEPARIADKISDAFEWPFSSSVGDITITASVGIASARPGAAITDQLIIDADHAMYEAKRRTRNPTQ